MMIYPAWVYTADPPAGYTATLAKRNLYSPASACYTLRGGVASTRLSRRAHFEEVVSRSLLREGCFEEDASRWFPSYRLRATGSPKSHEGWGHDGSLLCSINIGIGVIIITVVIIIFVLLLSFLLLLVPVVASILSISVSLGGS